MGDARQSFRDDNRSSQKCIMAVSGLSEKLERPPLVSMPCDTEGQTPE
jgi:hypothetical protein